MYIKKTTSAHTFCVDAGEFSWIVSNFCVGLLYDVWCPKKVGIRAGSHPIAFDTLEICVYCWNKEDPELEKSSYNQIKV